MLSAIYTPPGTGDAPEIRRSPVFSGAPTAPPVSPAPPFPIDQTFLLNSRPGASKTIYLDFDGHTTIGTEWNLAFNVNSIVTPPFDIDGNPGSFSPEEHERIQRIWLRTVEDFAPFDVNVTTQFTTEDALIRTTSADQFWGMRAAIGGTFNIIPGLGGAGGVAFVDVFGTVGSANFSPAFVFSDTQGNDEQVVTETISHEIGHTLGLSHDGEVGGLPYYLGHGFGETSWGSIMGAAFGMNVTQWNNGTYPAADNQEDDLAIIANPAINGFGYRPDDHGDTPATATQIQLTSAGSGTFFGVIERNTDMDVFQVLLPDGISTISALPNAIGPNLDIQLDLLDASGNVIATANPFDELDATISQTLRGGIYFARVQGTGKQPQFGDPGYPKYGSLGQYSLNFGVVPSSHIQGIVYLDGDADGARQAQDPPAAGFTVFIDDNFNGSIDVSESSTITDANGFYDLLTVPGLRNVRVLLPSGYFPTDPPSGVKTVSVGGNGAIVGGILLGISGAKGEIHGRKWLDVSGNASIDPNHGDGPLEGVYFYVDLDRDGRAGIGEPGATSDANGNFIIKNVPIGPRVLREVISPGFSTAFPTENNGTYRFNMTPGAIITGMDFFNSPAFDFGDAPDSYGTRLASNGPVHGYRQGFQLGANVDADADGAPTASALGDDNTAFDDEDGIRFLSVLTPGRQVQVEATINVPAFTQIGYLAGWLDFNGDGDFLDSGEVIIGSTRLGRGTHTFTINVPANVAVQPTYARFRYSTEATMGPLGRSLAGEVEDYRVLVLRDVPVANDDGDRPPLDAATPDIVVQQFSEDNRLNVLANDVRSTRGRIFIVPDEFLPPTGKTTVAGGTVTINDNNTPADPYDDFLEYDAAPVPANHTGRVLFDNFQYTISDGFTTDTATVYINIEKVSTPPLPIDDTFQASPSLTSPTTMHVLANDEPGTDRGTPNRSVALVDFDTQVRDEQGVLIGNVTRDTRGTPTNLADDRLVFTPVAGAANRTGQFTYTVNNPGSTDASLERQATVTVQVRSQTNTNDANDEVKLSVQAFEVVPATAGNPNGLGAAAPQALVQGQEYWVGVFADDLRTAFNLQSGGNGNGALAVYLDLLFDDRFVQAVRVPVTAQNPLGLDIFYGNRYDQNNTGASGAATPGGLIDELGITTIESVGAANQPVLYVKFRATTVTPGAGLVQMWKTDPADGKPADPSFDPSIIVNDENPPNSIRDVALSNVAYLRSMGYRVVAPSAPTMALADSSTSTTSTTSTTPTLALSPTTSSVSGPSQQELLAYYATLGLQTTSKSTTTSADATDQAITSLFSDLLASTQK